LAGGVRPYYAETKALKRAAPSKETSHNQWAESVSWTAPALRSVDSLMTGQTISHYQVLEKLGEGGMGVVYKARDIHLGRLVAVKVLSPLAGQKPDRKLRFLQEARAASALNHPNIITIYEIASLDDSEYIIMELIAGATLHDFIDRGRLAIVDALKYSVQIADALAAAHTAGIIHRDLKPANVMITP